MPHWTDFVNHVDGVRCLGSLGFHPHALASLPARSACVERVPNRQNSFDTRFARFSSLIEESAFSFEEAETMRLSLSDRESHDLSHAVTYPSAD